MGIEPPEEQSTITTNLGRQPTCPQSGKPQYRHRERNDG